MKTRILLCVLVAGLFSSGAMTVEPTAQFTRDEHVVYGEKDGRALTMDVFTPKENANGKGIVFIVSAGWGSNRGIMDWIVPHEFLRRGYTVFAAQHGCQPKFNIVEIVQDVNRAVRYVRFHAADYKVDPDALGVYGASAGGHLSLMVGTAGGEGDPKAVDPVDRVSSRVQAVGCFFPPTDFLNYGSEGVAALGEGVLAGFAAAFDFQEFSQQTKRYERITDPEKRKEIGRAISPITHVSADDPPTLIVHGDKDVLVPFQQAQVMVERLKAAGVQAELVVRPGAAHGWDKWTEDLKEIADWFDAHLKG